MVAEFYQSFWFDEGKEKKKKKVFSFKCTGTFNDCETGGRRINAILQLMKSSQYKFVQSYIQSLHS